MSHCKQPKNTVTFFLKIHQTEKENINPAKKGDYNSDDKIFELRIIFDQKNHRSKYSRINMGT